MIGSGIGTAPAIMVGAISDRNATTIAMDVPSTRMPVMYELPHG